MLSVTAAAAIVSLSPMGIQNPSLAFTEFATGQTSHYPPWGFKTEEIAGMMDEETCSLSPMGIQNGMV